MDNTILKHINSSSSFCLATLVNVRGSAPQNQGAKVIVFEDGSFEGTVGGGKIESYVVNYSLDFLKKNKLNNSFETWNLQRDIGMTCGGEVSFYFETYNRKQWNIVIFGAGHVSQSLTRVLSNLDCRITVVDCRQEWLEKLPSLNNINAVCIENMSDYVQEISQDSFIVVMTKGHSSDLPILTKILNLSYDFPYLGVIGSLSKRRSLEKGLKENKVDRNDFICPVGHAIGDNTPAEISISITSQLLEKKEQFLKC